MIITELNHVELLDANVKVDGLMIGVEGLSSDCYLMLTLDEACEIIKKCNTLNYLVYLDATNLFSDDELIKAIEIIKKLKTSGKIEGIMYEDLGLQEALEMDERIYYSLTYLTNGKDLQLALTENKMALISPLLTYQETLNLVNPNTFFIGFGTWRIFYSRRHLITNYLLYRHYELNDNYLKTSIVEETRPDDYYPIVEADGTKIYLHDYFYLEEVNNFPNLILKPFALDLSSTLKVIDLYNQKLNNQALLLKDELKVLNLKLHQGLLFEEHHLFKRKEV